MKRLVPISCASILSVFLIQSGDWRNSPYFNTEFLAQYDQVSHHLRNNEGLVEGFFLTEDTVSINYLWLKRPNARYTMIYCSGFWPGRKEGLATFYAMMPEDCNLLFFDARGHGKSTGHFLSRIWRYGTCEYKDVIAAVHFAAKQQRCPIILYGICAGAFHAVHALLHLRDRGMLHQAMHIKALIFDSGWSSLDDVSRTAMISEVDEAMCKQFGKTSWLYESVGLVAKAGVNLAHFCIIRPVLYLRRDEITLADKIERIDVPIFYIHAQGDQYANIEPVKELAEHTKRATCWWISEPSKHACHHLKLKEQYRERLLNFIESVL